MLEESNHAAHSELNPDTYEMYQTKLQLMNQYLPKYNQHRRTIAYVLSEQNPVFCP